MVITAVSFYRKQTKGEITNLSNSSVPTVIASLGVVAILLAHFENKTASLYCRTVLTVSSASRAKSMAFSLNAMTVLFIHTLIILKDNTSFDILLVYFYKFSCFLF